MIQLNGTVKIRGRKIPIFWTGEYAQHLADHYLNENYTHPFLHIEAQQMLAKCKMFKKSAGIYKIDNNHYAVIPFKIISSFAVIITAYIKSYEEE